MIYKTFSDIEDRIREELDLEDATDIISQARIMGYVNDAIDEIEKEIHTIYEDYFLTSEQPYVSSGDSEVSMPEDIFANKIRKIIYANGTDIYEVKRMRGPNMFGAIAEIDQNGDSIDYRYFIKNAIGDKPKIVVKPDIVSSSETDFTIWFIRNANRVTAEGDELDIPEGHNYIMAYTRWKVAKDIGDPDTAEYKEDAFAQKELLIETLTKMVPDDNDEVLSDTSFYEEHS